MMERKYNNLSFGLGWRKSYVCSLDLRSNYNYLMNTDERSLFN